MSWRSPFTTDAPGALSHRGNTPQRGMPADDRSGRGHRPKSAGPTPDTPPAATTGPADTGARTRRPLRSGLRNAGTRRGLRTPDLRLELPIRPRDPAQSARRQLATGDDLGIELLCEGRLGPGPNPDSHRGRHHHPHLASPGADRGIHRRGQLPAGPFLPQPDCSGKDAADGDQQGPCPSSAGSCCRSTNRSNRTTSIGDVIVGS